MDKLTVAMARGEKDGTNHAQQVAGGLQGAYVRNDYPSNPYNETADSELWTTYNAAFSAQQIGDK